MTQTAPSETEQPAERRLVSVAFPAVGPSGANDGVALSKELKKRGWRFVGPTTVYAFMQAMGMVNDHAESCVIFAKAEKARKRFRKREVS